MNNTMKLVERADDNSPELEAEMRRIRNLFGPPSPHDHEDLISYAKRVLRLVDRACENDTLQARVKCLEEALGESVSAMEPLGYYFELNDQRDGNLEVPVRELRAILRATIAARTTLANQGGEK